MSGHSNIGPSSSDRWMNCPGSVRLSEGLPNPTNEHAAAGIVAHDLAHKLMTGAIDDLELLAMIGKTIICDKHEVEVDEDMTDGVMLYRDTIMEDVDMLARLRPGREVHKHFETKVEFGGGVWGTADAIVYVKGFTLIVYDFKYGRGVVEAEENPQMGIYGVAAMRTIAGEAFDEVWLKIVQPRAGHIDGPVRAWKASKDWLKKFASSVEAAVVETQKPDAKIVAGDHCKWCPAKKAGCPIFGEAVQREASMSFDVVPPSENEVKAKVLTGLPTVRMMTLEKLARAYGWREAIEAWFGDIADLIREKLEAGEDVPGWKLVDGGANRKLKDGAEAEIVARYAPTYGEDKLYKPRVLLGITALEKLIGKKEFEKLDVTFRPELRKAIAKDIDGRPKANTAAQDAFGVIETTAVKALPAPVADDDDIFGEATPATSGPKRDPMWPV